MLTSFLRKAKHLPLAIHDVELIATERNLREIPNNIFSISVFFSSRSLSLSFAILLCYLLPLIFIHNFWIKTQHISIICHSKICYRICSVVIINRILWLPIAVHPYLNCISMYSDRVLIVVVVNVGYLYQYQYWSEM